MNIILALITGFCISVMIYFNGSLEGIVGNLPSLIFIHATGIAVTGLLFIKKTDNKLRERKSKWFLLAGVIGIVVVSINNQVFSKGGVLLALSGTLAGQVLTAFIVELYNHKKIDKKIPLGKILSVTLVLPGSIFLGLRSNMPYVWILISWVPGILIMLQSFMNSQNILSIGFKKTLLFHFGTTLIILLPLMFIFPITDAITKILSNCVPLQYLFGGGTIALVAISLGSYLLLKLNPITYVLLLYSGQLSGALILDVLSGIPLSIEKMIALVLIILGLFIGEYRKKII